MGRTQKRKLEDQIVVKVQAAIASNAGPKMVLIYNEDRTAEWQGDAPEIYDLIYKWMKMGAITQPKAYFLAHFEGTLIALDEGLDDEDPRGGW